MDESQEPGSVHGSLTSSDLSLGRKQDGLTTGTLVENDKREMSKPYDRREAFVKALQKSADRENEQRRAMSLTEVQAEIWKVVNGFHITGPGVTGQGTSWSVHPEQPRNQNRTDSVAAADMHPFKVTDASGEDFMGLALAKNSFLYTTTNLATPYTFTRSWADATAGDKFYLEITLDNTLAVTAADMLLDAGWGGYDDMFHIDSTDPDNPFVDKIRVLIAEIVASTDPRDGIAMGGLGTGNKIIQHQRNDIQLLSDRDVNGCATLFPVNR